MMEERKNHQKEVELMPKMFCTDVSHCRGLLPELIPVGRCVLKFAQTSPSRDDKIATFGAYVLLAKDTVHLFSNDVKCLCRWKGSSSSDRS
jgi:hypothetical protein